MEKAFDIKDLGNKLKARGLDLAEEALVIVYEETKAWFKESAALSENKIDDIVAPFIDQLDPIVKPLIDKVDGTKDAL